MRHGTQGRRSRGRGHNGGHNGGQHNGQRRNPTHNRNQIFDSNGPDVRIRGTAHQVCEKYLALAKDASSTGDTILAESYLQHAEHYQRIINIWNEEFQTYQRQNNTYATDMAEEQDASIDDLSLPISVLGGDIKPKLEESVRVGQTVGQDMLEAV